MDVVDSMVKSDVFPNLMVDPDIKAIVDDHLRQLRDCKDPDVQHFVAAVSRLDYQIKNGSPAGSDLCEASSDSSSRIIYLPVNIVGTYTGRDGAQHPITLARMLMHELTHATSKTSVELSLNHSVMLRLLQLKMEYGQAAKGTEFPTDIAQELMTVRTENFLVAQVFHDTHPRGTVADKNPNFSVEDLKHWGETGYPVQFECLQKVPLSSENDLLNQPPDVALNNHRAQFLAQIADMSADDRHIMMAQFDLRALQQVEQSAALQSISA
jgi:hypothetical protein